MNDTNHNPPSTAAPRNGLYLAISGISAIVCAVLAVSMPGQFWPGFLTAANWWFSISLGCLGITLIHCVSGGRWGYAVGRGLHAGIGTIGITFLLTWIAMIGGPYLFPWADPTRAAHLNPFQKVFLDPWAVGIRYIAFGAIWVGMGAWMNSLYRREAADRTKFPPQRLSGLGIIVFFVTVSCAAVDFMMALTPAWSSSIFPLIRLLNCAVSAIAVVLISRLYHPNEPTVPQTALTHDNANMMQAFNLLWTYLAFSQYILIWGGDIPMEVEWYTMRKTPFGMFVSTFLFLFHFIIPLLLLLLRPLKKRLQMLFWVCVLMLFVCWVDVAWIIIPSCPDSGAMSVLASLVSILAIGGIWIVNYNYHYARLPDMTVEEAHHAHGHAHAGDSHLTGETV